MEAQKSPKIESQPEEGKAARDERESVEAKRVSVGNESSNQEGKAAAQAKDKSSRSRKSKNNVRKLRTERMMSKAELARRAGLSTLTIDRVERGMPCRMDTKRKILEAMGLRPSDRVMVFGDTPEEGED